MGFEAQSQKGAAVKEQLAKLMDLVSTLRVGHDSVFPPIVIQSAQRVFDTPESKRPQVLAQEKEYLNALNDLGSAVQGTTIASLAVAQFEGGSQGFTQVMQMLLRGKSD